MTRGGHGGLGTKPLGYTALKFLRQNFLGVGGQPVGLTQTQYLVVYAKTQLNNINTHLDIPAYRPENGLQEPSGGATRQVGTFKPKHLIVA